MSAPRPPAQSPRPPVQSSRHWPIVVATALLGLILGIVSSSVLPSTYAARSTVSVRAVSFDARPHVDSSRPASMSTEEEIARSRNVTEVAAMRLTGRFSLTAQEIQDALVVSSPDQSSVLSIEFGGTSSEQSAAVTEAVAEAYLAVRRRDASAELDRLSASVSGRLAELQAAEVDPDSTLGQRATRVQIDALARQLAHLSTIDPTPGQIVSTAQEPTHTSPAPVLLGVAGTILGLLVGLLLRLSRTTRKSSTLGCVEDITSLGDHLVLDGTHDVDRSDTWTLAAGLLRLPDDLRSGSFVIMVDAEDEPRAEVRPGQELVDALARRGRVAQLVDTSRINEGKIYRGWPTLTNRSSWWGSIVVLDTTAVTSDALKIALAARSDSVVLARSTNDDAAALHRLTTLMRRGNAAVDLMALFPPRSRWRATRHHPG